MEFSKNAGQFIPTPVGDEGSMRDRVSIDHYCGGKRVFKCSIIHVFVHRSNQSSHSFPLRDSHSWCTEPSILPAKLNIMALTATSTIIIPSILCEPTHCV